ncbi:hypothetical protein [Acaryochloris marina]|uniref:hypothetical protein n=1 Tax=Acaryochloris marina TaxID=155978 RepID=UPI0021C2B04C|nr:hypothetical protein [Acaryochloris marina]BDM83766.1 hypothetical protein AM10699_66270 [Acaryochloris marina MBIC10699]
MFRYRLYSLTSAGLLVGSILTISTPASSHNTSSCEREFSALFNKAELNALTIRGSSVTARGNEGFTSFTMSPTYQVENMPLHTSGARVHDIFIVDINGNSAKGKFVRVFPGRGNGNEDETELFLTRSGNLSLRSIKWNTEWEQLRNISCYRGPGQQLVVTAHAGNQFDRFGPVFWTFMIKASECGEIPC